ncbi:par A family ATPase/WD repeat iron cluster assembly fusion protein [Schizosaccharomyces japonicus yFS275]|uniref:Probable cytosolic Fe-S cluster assembly factor SJAG_02895 n=1 Tax=Schizosaccharomyces japonicus (strain yFS275 / FY16936) TaxID=402676 RepID=CFD1_SCHJY|nr:par A family ATPase/WD repeat iron cluster assembly fusion protein [Schizosaccharomyces japonicus yFS275]B6K1G6.2 RecName: Full=Probable cytosolic Fe-S cluster assembly factor SJAG_02895 [Schizosaccharomyces japonicus yFS275]EEB07787.2 par A family ATPase/WD repeat iron cluster assembly fusion protein [Schizosaccharomyces japonicus yFS275]
MENVKHIILVLSGKGGVGKSSVTTQLALSLHETPFYSRKLRIGVLDIDLTGPSIPRMFGMDAETHRIHQSSSGWVPVYTDETKEIGLMSLAFLLSSKNDSVVWRGPKKAAMIRQFVSDVNWGDIDYLLIDTPPGTSDEHLTIVESLLSVTSERPQLIDGAVMVTTPQNVATLDVKKEINFCQNLKIPILGVVENMSGFVCPHCSDCTNIFSKGGGEQLSNTYHLPFLGAVPIDPKFGELIESQSTEHPLIEHYKQLEVAKLFQKITQNMLDSLFHSPSLVLDKVLSGHRGRIWSVAVHPTLPLVATASEDKSVRVFQAQTGELIHVIDGYHTRSVRRVAWRPIDRPVLAIASFDATVSIYEKIDDDWECVAALEGHENEVKCVAWSHDGVYLATCSRDKSVWIWEAMEDDEFDCLAVLQEHTQDVKVVAWHPKDDLLVSGSYDNTIRFWRDDGDDWVQTCELTSHTSTVWALNFSPDGRLLASGDGEGEVFIWEKLVSNEDAARTPSTNILRPSLEEEWCLKAVLPRTFTEPVYTLGWKDDHTLCASGAEGTIGLFAYEDDVSTWHTVSLKEKAHDVYEINTIAWTNDSRLLSGGDDGLCNVWKLSEADQTA